MIHITLIFVDLVMAVLMSALWVAVIAALVALLLAGGLAALIVFARRKRGKADRAPLE